MQEMLPRTLPDFSRARVLVIGDVMLDRYWFGDTQRISPEAPVPIVKINNMDNRPGGAGNVALNIAALGGVPILLGLTGNDEASQTLKEQLTAAQVQHDLVSENHLSTIIKLRIISKHQQLLRLDFEEKLTITNPKKLVDRFQHYLNNVDLILLSDYSKGTLCDPQTLIQLANNANVPVIVDPKGTNFQIYKNASIITPNFKEFEAVVGKCHTEEDIVSKGRELINAIKIHTLLITRGEDGMTLINQRNVYHLPAYAREVFDVTGAGDTVIGVLGAAIAAGSDIPSASALANLAASLVVNKLGAASVSVPEIEVALHGKTNFTTGIVNEEQLNRAVAQARTQHKKIIFTNGCFDIIHAGHVTSLQMAKQLGDYLIVAVNSDESIRRLKGPSRPINHLDHRMTVLAGLGVVDWVVPFDDDTPERLLRLIKPDLLVKGSDYSLDQVVGADIVRSYGGEVRIMNHNITTSSSSILKQIETYEAEENG